MVDKDILEKQALTLIAQNGKSVTTRLAEEFGVSKQAISMHLKDMVSAGQIAAKGSTRALVYELVTQKEIKKTYARQGLQEDQVWMEVFAPALMDLPEAVRDIWHYGITEMVNNAVDHSESESVAVEFRRNALFSEGTVIDSGVGIFVKIQRALNLYDPRDAILELAKGKFTTDPARHSGEGIFFSSKAFDDFTIHSSRLDYSHNRESSFGVLTDHGGEAKGTRVQMRLANDSPRLIRDVFDEFAAPEEFTFAKTLVPVRLAQYEGEKLISRSQAKRLTMRFEKFKHVMLDFDGVNEIGQAFADELFRVFVNAHPQIKLTTTNMTEAVAQMAKRVTS